MLAIIRAHRFGRCGHNPSWKNRLNLFEPEILSKTPDNHGLNATSVGSFSLRFQRVTEPRQCQRYAVEPMHLELEKRLAAIKWEEFTHPCGFKSQEIPSLIIKLDSGCEVESLRAANRLWNVVSHQGCVGSNSVPTLPFLLERLVTVSMDVQEEILDIIYQFSCAACPSNSENWARELRQILTANRTQFEQLLESQNEGVIALSEAILEQIGATSCEHVDHDTTA